MWQYCEENCGNPYVVGRCMHTGIGRRTYEKPDIATFDYKKNYYKWQKIHDRLGKWLNWCHFFEERSDWDDDADESEYIEEFWKAARNTVLQEWNSKKVTESNLNKTEVAKRIHNTMRPANVTFKFKDKTDRSGNLMLWSPQHRQDLNPHYRNMPLLHDAGPD